MLFLYPAIPLVDRLGGMRHQTSQPFLLVIHMCFKVASRYPFPGVEHRAASPAIRMRVSPGS